MVGTTSGCILHAPSVVHVDMCSIGCLSQGLIGQEGPAGSICIYYDGVQLGSVLRPDRGRSFLAVYWGVKGIIDFCRSRGLWWTTLMFVPTGLVKSIKGGLSAPYLRDPCALGVSNSTRKAWALASLLEKQLVTFTCIFIAA